MLFWEKHSSHSFVYFNSILDLILSNFDNIDMSIQTTCCYKVFSNYNRLNIFSIAYYWPHCFSSLVLTDVDLSLCIASNDWFPNHCHVSNGSFVKLHSFLLLNSSYIFPTFWIPHFQSRVFWAWNDSLSIWSEVSACNIFTMPSKSHIRTIIDIPHPDKSVFWGSDDVVSFLMPVSKVNIVVCLT